MKNRCNTTCQSIAEWLDLSEAQRSAVRGHAEACGDCQVELESTLRIVGHLEAGREAYVGLRYSGHRPDFGAVEGGRRGVGATGWDWRQWRPVAVVLATVLVSVSLALLVTTNESPPVDDGRSNRTERLKTETSRRAVSAPGTAVVPESATAPQSISGPEAAGVPEDPAAPTIEVERNVVSPQGAEVEAAGGDPGASSAGSPKFRIPSVGAVSPSASLGAIRRRALQLESSNLTKRPVGFGLHLPKRPIVRPRPDAKKP